MGITWVDKCEQMLMSQLISQVAANSNVTVDFKFNPAPAINTATGGLTSYFSSIGPTNNGKVRCVCC
jgi:hypothetical protein